MKLLHHNMITSRQEYITRHNEETTKPNETTTTHNEEATQHNVVTATHNDDTTQNNGKKTHKKVMAFHNIVWFFRFFREQISCVLISYIITTYNFIVRSHQTNLLD